MRRDKENLIKACRCCHDGCVEDICPFYDEGCIAYICRNEELGKEPVKVPKNYLSIKTFTWTCPNCKYEVGYKWKYCPQCGQKMNWTKFE